MTRLGSLCTGTGALDLAVAEVYAVDHVWHAENDPDASKVPAAHWPDVPNLGDLTAVDWTTVEPVDIVTAGYPCQPLSTAGKRKGTDDDRWIWDDIARAVRVLRPRLVVLENVSGHLSLGFGRVLGDLAAAGFDAEWGCFRASDVGAPHRRERVFVVAWPADADRTVVRDTAWQGSDTNHCLQSGSYGTAGTATHPDGGAVRQQPVPDAGSGGTAVARGSGARTPVSLLPTPRVSMEHGPSQRELDEGDPKRWLETAVALLPTPNAAQGRGTGTPSRETATRRMYKEGRRFLDDAVALLPTPRATDGVKGGPNQRGSSGDLMLPSAVQPDRWGDYAPAIARWEHVTGRPAPEPTKPGTKGQPRLSARFVEWLMGLPDGWVTDHLPRNPALRMLGNGVVPQQAAHAIRELVSP